MTKVLFETATIAGSILQAAKVAPTRGEAFDKAHGILIEVWPDNDIKIVIRSTNLDVFYTEWVDCMEAEGEAVRWRLPSQLIGGLMGKFPIGSGKTCSFEQVGSQLIIKQGRTTAKCNLLQAETFPPWDYFATDGLEEVSELGSLLGQVEWAAAKDGEPPFTGVYIDGTYLISTDRYRIARVPLEIPHLKEPVTIPARTLSAVIRENGLMKMGASADQLYLMPDAHTQVRATIYGKQFPDMNKIISKNDDKPQRVNLRKAELLEVINRTSLFTGADRSPMLALYFGKSEVGALMSNDEIGMIGDVIEVPGQADHPRVAINFTPQNLIEALSACPYDSIVFGYDVTDTLNKPVHIFSDLGYEAWVMPRRGIGEKK